ncbi:hypothetical protein, partial [Enterococcus hirae]|uniref:hypothetical protein n=1 Tax=Enterococcus hirae TaxID=1354 RepID=UPI001A968BF0
NLREQLTILQHSKASLENAAHMVGTLANVPIPAIAELLRDQQRNFLKRAESYQKDITRVKKKIQKLTEFDARTKGLFQSSLDDFQLAMQAVMVLNETTVNSDGSYSLPKGVDKSWFTQIKNTEPSEDVFIEIANRLGIPWEELVDIYRSLKNSSGAESFFAIIALMEPDSLTKGGFSEFGLHGEKTFNYLMRDWRSIKKQLRKLDNPAAKKLLSSMDGSFNQFLKNIEKLKDFKGVSKYTKPLSRGANWVSSFGKEATKTVGKKVLKSVKPLGKIAGKVGWAGMILNAGYDVVTNFNKEEGDVFQKVGKSVVHAGVNQLKNAGPIEGALGGSTIGSFFGPGGAAIGAGVGFIAGTINSVWGVVHSESKDKVYGAIEKGGDWVMDKIDDVGKSIGKAAQGAWNSFTSFFNGGKYAYG